MSYSCEVSGNLFSVLPKWSRVIFTLNPILVALISNITGASFGTKVDWALDFYQSIFHSNLRRIHIPELIHRA